MLMDEKVQILWDYAVAHPDGFTRYDVQNDIGWSNSELSDVARHLRQFFADDVITLTATPQGQHEPWIYQLVGTLEAAGPWSRNRLLDTETRLSTIHAVAKSLVHATDGRQRDGKKARVIERTLRHLQENLAAITEDS